MKTLIYDLEVSPILGWVYEKYDTNLVEMEHDYFLLSFAYKWLGEKQVYFFAPGGFCTALVSLRIMPLGDTTH